MNTFEKGRVRYVIFKDEDGWYAAALEFNIVEHGDTYEEAWLMLFEAMKGYVDAARKIKARPNILNQKADAEYEKMWKESGGTKAKKSNVFSAGFMNLAQFDSCMVPA
ncbi:type II toxin-antitoxin system HicB family antitoxin [Patescibacteria group bacterium]|nr:type II toxin-antitoxin system HicB family antitoxin [Patescibacteria group bacterium]MBU1448756.1 type II toxin-antitoxin system HicB family antitoxin [Patescibacteria group bacterium]MBU2613510.1 type II toxin-antitoxin system HicB family antitoxin [Patescibacteria group bacterium]